MHARLGFHVESWLACRCVSSLLLKWKRLFNPPQLVRLCTFTTLAAFLPSMLLQIRDTSPPRLLISLALTSLSFFQFSYQVGMHTHLPHDNDEALSCCACSCGILCMRLMSVVISVDGITSLSSYISLVGGQLSRLLACENGCALWPCSMSADTAAIYSLT